MSQNPFHTPKKVLFCICDSSGVRHNAKLTLAKAAWVKEIDSWSIHHKNIIPIDRLQQRASTLETDFRSTVHYFSHYNHATLYARHSTILVRDAVAAETCRLRAYVSLRLDCDPVYRRRD